MQWVKPGLRHSWQLYDRMFVFSKRSHLERQQPSNSYQLASIAGNVVLGIHSLLPEIMLPALIVFTPPQQELMEFVAPNVKIIVTLFLRLVLDLYCNGPTIHSAC